MDPRAVPRERPVRCTGHREVVVCGAGPAGLTAGYLLTREGRPPLILETDPHYVGGISRTVRHNGYSFDVGGHRFFSHCREVEGLWDEILPEDLLIRERKSRIYYRGRFFAYPLKPVQAVTALGPLEIVRCLASYTAARLRPIRSPASFEDWVTNQFGSRLYEIFFKAYTEKVWGMRCSDISADWAIQRIQSLSLSSAVVNALRSMMPSRRSSASSRGAGAKTLLNRFRYPRLGPGMMWEACAARIEAGDGQVRLGCTITGLEPAGGGWRVSYRDVDGDDTVVTADHVISSLPLRDVVGMLEVDDEIRRSAASLRYRDFLTVALIMRDRSQFDDQWIYIQDPAVKVGRIQNFKSWSPDLVPDTEHCCYGLEYFCFQGDGLWESSDADLIALAVREIQALGLAQADDLSDACVVRQPKAYPVYDEDYAVHVSRIRDALAEYPGLHQVGRNGMHQYNNQDHSMITAMLTVRNILAGDARFDPWRVNQNAEYQEYATAEGDLPSSKRAVPGRIRARTSPDPLTG